MTYHDGIREPYNRLHDGQTFYDWKEAAKARLVELFGCSEPDAALALSEIMSCAGRGHAHEPIRTQAFREAARAYRIYPGTDEIARIRYAFSIYLQTLNLAARKERGEFSDEEAISRIKQQRTAT